MTSASRLADRFDVSHSPLIGTRTERQDFDAWLAGYWVGECPPEPDTCPDAVSFLAGAVGGEAIRWYDADDAVLGYVPGLPRRCWRVPRTTTEPALDLTSDDDDPPCAGDEHDHR